MIDQDRGPVSLTVTPGIDILATWLACFAPCVSGTSQYVLLLSGLLQTLWRFIHSTACCCGSLSRISLCQSTGCSAVLLFLGIGITSSLGLSWKELLGTFLYMSLGKHRKHFCWAQVGHRAHQAILQSNFTQTRQQQHVWEFQWLHTFTDTCHVPTVSLRPFW